MNTRCDANFQSYTRVYKRTHAYDVCECDGSYGCVLRVCVVSYHPVRKSMCVCVFCWCESDKTFQSTVYSSILVYRRVPYECTHTYTHNIYPFSIEQSLSRLGFLAMCMCVCVMLSIVPRMCVRICYAYNQLRRETTRRSALGSARIVNSSCCAI